MIITLYGPDSYRRKIKLDSLVSEYLQKRQSMAYGLFDLAGDDLSSGDEEGNFQKFAEFLKTPSLFQSAKLAVLKNPFSFENQAKLKKIMKELILRDVNLIISDSTRSIKKEFDFLKEKPNVSQIFDKLSGPELAHFIKEAAKEKEVVLQDGAVKFLAAALPSDSWGIVNELAKLKFTGIKKPIDVAVLKAAGLVPEEDFFSMVSGWLSRPIHSRLFSLEKIFYLKEETPKIFNILAYQDISKLRNFADYDVAIKSGKLDYDEVLLDLALR
ncbi:MAG: hypothetical protein HYT12_01710 [Candidatus Liptonbacteria bacterium]|nr:hypothetical protein [Candidatus Liptonbacteria bacterium]